MSERIQQLRVWLHKELGTSEYSLEPASEDASFRQYYRVEYNNTSRIVMDAPPAQEHCRPYVDIAKRLRNCGVNAPEIHTADLEQGFLLMTDLGRVLYLDILTEANVDSLYNDALASLVKIQQRGDQKNIPPYDEALLMGEMALFRDWLLQKHLGIALSPQQQTEFDQLFNFLSRPALEQPRVFVHRDYHSRNLVHCKSDNPGIVDFQDAVSGPFTYDLVSLLKDCYIKWPREQVNNWAIKFYQQIRPGKSDAARFLRWFDLMGVQRSLKASGIFARLYHRDGKAGYLKDIPRTLSYIIDLEQDYPELNFLIEFIRSQVLQKLEKVNNKCAQ
jgi:hypothetical protein